jgi:uncharacterized membrane protein
LKQKTQGVIRRISPAVYLLLCSVAAVGAFLLIRKGGGMMLPWKYALLSMAILPCIAAGIWAGIRPGAKPEYLFLCLFLGLGLVWSLALTPFSPPDEETHYFRALHISDTLFFGDKGRADANYILYNQADYDVHVNSEMAMEGALSRFCERPSGRTAEIPLKAVWLPDYAPAVAGLTLGRALGVSQPLLLLFGRWSVLLACAALLWLAVRTAPMYKPLLALCALTPMALQIAVTLSYDGMILGMSALLLALLLRLVTGEGPVPAREMAALVILTVLLTISKVAYAAPALLMLAIPRHRLSPGKKAVWAAILGVCAGVAALLSGLSLYAANSGLNWEGQYNYSPAELLRQPLKLARILLDTIWYYKDFYLFGAVGKYLSGLTLTLSDPLSWSWLGLLLLCAVLGERRTLKLSRRLLLLGGYLLAGLILLLGLLFGNTSNTRVLVEGVQGRYFTPLLPVVLLLFGCGKLSLPESRFPLWIAPAALLQIWTVAELLKATM